MKTITIFPALLLTLIALAGCGGGGGSSTNTPVNGQAAAVTAAQAVVSYAGSQAALGGVTGTGGDLSPLIVRIAKRALSSVAAKPKDASQWTELGQVGNTILYFDSTTSTDTVQDVLLSTDDNTNNAGYLDLNVTSGSINSLPVTIKAKFNIILPSQTLAGNMTFNITDDNDFNAQVTETATPPGVTLSYTVTDQGGQFNESLTSTKGSIKITFTNVVASGSGFTANFSVNGITGTATENGDGSGSAQATDSTGLWTVSWDANDNATLTSPTGQISTGTLASLQV